MTGTKRITLCMRSAIVVPDAQVRAHHVFLIPDEGYGAVVRLHGRLQRAAVLASLRPTLTYLPHLTVASMSWAEEAQRVADDLNARDFAVKGHINDVVIHRRDGEVIRTVATIPLAKPALFGA